MLFLPGQQPFEFLRETKKMFFFYVEQQTNLIPII